MALRHGHARTGGSRTYHAWKSMVRRCTKPAAMDWSRYGGRGITVCDRWRHFDNFLADMGTCPDGLTLDRINNEGNYEPGNCRWATWEQQYRNRRSNAGERHPNAKLSAADVALIRELARRGHSVHELGWSFGVTRQNIGYIVQGKAWREQPQPQPSGRQLT